jgi:hypothetical protein
MPRFRVEVQADALAHMLREYLKVAPLALAHVLSEIGYLDGHPSQVPGHGVQEAGVHRAPALTGACRHVEGRYVHGDDGELVVVQEECGRMRPCPDHDTAVEMSSVDRAVIARADLVATLHQIEDDTRTLAAILSSSLTVARGALGQRAPRFDVPECNRGVGREGVIEWGRPWCNAVPDETRAGMCDDCWTAEAMWRELHGLEPRRRTERAAPPRPMCARDGCTREATVGRTDGLCDAHRMQDSRARRRAEVG